MLHNSIINGIYSTECGWTGLHGYNNNNIIILVQVPDQVGCWHTGQHQFWVDRTGSLFRCRTRWAVGMQDSTSSGLTGLGPCSGAGPGGLLACRTAPVLG